MGNTADRGLTPEQEQMRSVIDRYARIAALTTGVVIALGALYLSVIYLATSR
jgi:ABC-type uncharacterized transport system permease subunit